MRIGRDLIVGENKLRDLDICNLYIMGKTATEIKAHRNLSLSPRRIEQIIYANSSFVNPRMAWPKSKRIQRLQRIADRLEGKDSPKRDELDVLVELRKEIEGDKALVDNSTHEHITIIVDQKAAEELKIGREVHPELQAE